MNILIPDSWLRNFIETKADARTIAEKLSLTSFNVEKIHREGGDFIYEIEMTPNRGDALSVLGIAREVYASLKSFGIEAELKRGYPSRGVTPQGPLQLKVKLDPKLCPHFAALILDNVKIKPSPKKIQDRLEKAGIRALNNVIDVTNYIMLERGQPMHAFDWDKLGNVAAAPEPGAGHGPQLQKTMILRESRKDETLVTLDGVERELPQGSIIIEDGEKIIDLCGIMGGANSAIDKSTKRVILFAQIYNPAQIRKTSMKLGLRTEAAQRFEKGLDPKMVLPALFKAVRMLEKNAGAWVASKLINIRQKEFKSQTVKLTMEKLTTYLGAEIDSRRVTRILKSLGFTPTPSCHPERSEGSRRDSSPPVADQNDQTLSFEVPSWRDQDIQIEEDLIEEVARLYGYYKIPSLLPKGRPPLSIHNRKFAIEKRLKVLLKDLGFTEIYTYSMVKEPQIRNALKLRNPLTEDLTYMRIELIPSLLNIIEENRARFPKMKIFEMANGYFPLQKGELPYEKLFLTCLVTEEKESNQGNFAAIKGLLETIFRELNIKDYVFKSPSTFPYSMETYPFDPENSAIIWPKKPISSGKIITPIGKVKNTRGYPSQGVTPKGDIWGFQIHMEALAELASEVKTYHPIPQFPPIIEDISLFVDRKTPVGNLANTIQKLSDCQTVKLTTELIDIYEDGKLKKEGKKSLTFRITYQAPDRSLSDKEVKPIREKIIKTLEKNFRAKIRGDPLSS